MIDFDKTDTDTPAWFAIKTRQDFRAAETLSPLCEEVFFPTEERESAATGRMRLRAVIPHVVFVKTVPNQLLALEQAGREHPELSVPFWIYRYPTDNKIQMISQRQINLLRLLTVNDTTRCEIYNSTDFKESEHVRITGGLYKGFEGYVQRVKKNKHVVVRIEGICAILLPFIHPDLLEKID